MSTGEAIWAWTKFIAVIVLVVFGMKSCYDSAWFQRSMQWKAEQDQRDATPHVIREADGCKVYAFKSQDRWMYFTRCAASSTTTTIAPRSVPCGKGCVKTVDDGMEVKQ